MQDIEIASVSVARALRNRVKYGAWQNFGNLEKFFATEGFSGPCRFQGLKKSKIRNSKIF